MVSTPPRPRDTDPQAHHELIALKAWRDQAVRDRRIPLGSIKDGDLSRIVNYARHDLRQIRGILSESNRHLAEEILDVQLAITGASGSAQPVAPVPSGAAATQPVQVLRATEPHGPPEPLAPTPVDPMPTFADTRTVSRSGEPGVLRTAETADQLRLTWPAVGSSPVTVFRVVSRDDWPPGSPGAGTLMYAGRDVTTLDARAPTRAVRYYSVFANSGYTEAEAYAAQPALVAQGTHYFSLPVPTWQADEGILNLRWTRLPGMLRVRVFRIPIEQSGWVLVPDERHALAPDQVHLDSVLDLTATPGATYRYDFQPEIEIMEGGEQRIGVAPTVSVDITIPAPLVAVTNLVARRHLIRDGLTAYEVTWTQPPAGQVEIYCAPTGPDPGARDGAHDYGALATSLGLPALFRRHSDHVDDLGGGQMMMRAVRPDPAWERVHFTPVTVLYDRVLVGPTTVEVVIGSPGLPVIVERSEYQALKFAWPTGAAKVVTVVQRLDAPPAPISQVQIWFDEIDETDWTELGCLSFRQRLAPEGCRVDLAGIAYRGSIVEFGPTVSTSYPGLTRISYRLNQQRRFLRKSASSVTIQLCADRPMAMPLSFNLVHNAERLPLHPRDGQVLSTIPAHSQLAARPQPSFTPDRLTGSFGDEGWVAEVAGLRGYLRLFLLDDLEVALLDPPPERLMLT